MQIDLMFVCVVVEFGVVLFVLICVMVCFMLLYFVYFVLFGFGSGFVLIMFGMFGLLFGWFMFVVFNCYLMVFEWWVLIVVGFMVGMWVIGFIVRKVGVVDLGVVVWDEIVVIWFVMLFVMFVIFVGQLWVFVVFCFFDMFKLLLICYFDCCLKGGFGIMVDDLVVVFMMLFVIVLWCFVGG